MSFTITCPAGLPKGFAWQGRLDELPVWVLQLLNPLGSPSTCPFGSLHQLASTDVSNKLPLWDPSTCFYARLHMFCFSTSLPQSNKMTLQWIINGLAKMKMAKWLMYLIRSLLNTNSLVFLSANFKELWTFSERSIATILGGPGDKVITSTLYNRERLT